MRLAGKSSRVPICETYVGGGERLGSQSTLFLCFELLIKLRKRDAAGLMDIIEVNEYFGTWYPGTLEAWLRHLDDLHAAFPVARGDFRVWILRLLRRTVRR